MPLQVLAASEPDPTPRMQVTRGPGLKLTAARTHARWPAALTSSSDTNCWSPQHSSTAGQQVEVDSGSGGAAGGLQTELLQLRAAEAEVVALLDSCMQDMEAVIAASGPRAAQSALRSKHSSNIVPWAQTATTPAAAPAAAAASTGDAAGVSEVALPDAPASAAAAAAQPPPPPPPAAAAEPATLVTVAETHTEQLVMVYSSAASHDPSSPAAAAAAHPVSPAVVGGVVPPSVRYLRLPQQQAEYDDALQQGMRVVPVALTGCGSSLSCEELAWMSQVAGCWGTEQGPAEFFSPGGSSTPAADEAGDAR